MLFIDSDCLVMIETQPFYKIYWELLKPARMQALYLV